MIYTRGEDKINMFELLGKILTLVETIKLIYQLTKWVRKLCKEVQGAISPFLPSPLKNKRGGKRMSDKIWHGLLIFVLIGKTIEYSYKLYKWYKDKKNKNSEK